MSYKTIAAVLVLFGDGALAWRGGGEGGVGGFEVCGEAGVDGTCRGTGCGDEGQQGGLPTFRWVLQGGAPRGEGASDPVPAGTSRAPAKLHRQLLIHLEGTCSQTALGKGLRRCEISLFLSLGETNLLLEIELEGWQIMPVHQLNIHCP